MMTMFQSPQINISSETHYAQMIKPEDYTALTASAVVCDTSRPERRTDDSHGHVDTPFTADVFVFN